MFVTIYLEASQAAIYGRDTIEMIKLTFEVYGGDWKSGNWIGIYF